MAQESSNGGGSVRTRRLDPFDLVLGLVALVLGLVLLSDPTADVATLARLIGAALVVLGFGRFLDGRSTTGRARVLDTVIVGAWIVVGLLGVTVAGLRLRTLAVLVGSALVLGGALDLFAAAAPPPARETTSGDGRRSRVADALGATLGIALGATALVWPTVTVLVLSTVVGARTVYASADRIIRSLRRRGERSEPGWVALALRSIAVVVAVALLGVSVAINRSQPEGPGPFYDRPRRLPSTPGTVIRSETIDGYIAGALTRRILYATTDRSERRITASALVFVPGGTAPADGRPIAAIDHGTIGIDRRCAPSLLPGRTYAPAIAGLRGFLDAGFVVVATDYAGLGSDAVNGFLIGTDEARSTLDGVRATVALADTHAQRDFVVFGESQGGHAALFTGEMVSTYAPDLRLRGVAAAAPATDLATLFEANVGTPFGDILAAFALVSWSRAYRPGDLGLDQSLDLDQVLDPDARPSVERLAALCIQNPRQIAGLFPEAAILSNRFLSKPPWKTEPWSSVIAANTPGDDPTPAPILLVQGADDPLVLPKVQDEFVQRLCTINDIVDYRTLPRVGHLDVGQAAAAQVVQWSTDRIARKPSTSTC